MCLVNRSEPDYRPISRQIHETLFRQKLNFRSLTIIDDKRKSFPIHTNIPNRTVCSLLTHVFAPARLLSATSGDHDQRFSRGNSARSSSEVQQPDRGFLRDSAREELANCDGQITQ